MWYPGPRGNCRLSSQPRFGECLVECFECFRFSRLGIGHFGCIVLLFCLTDEFRKVFFCVLGFIRFFLFFVVTLNVINSRIVCYATIRLRHVLILATDAVTILNLRSGQVGFRNSVVCRFLSCVSATSVLNMSKTK